MSVTMTKNDGASVLTLTHDPQNSSPRIRQILKSLCYSPAWCSVSQHLRRFQGSSQVFLGTMQIVVGLLNTGIGVTVQKIAWDFWWNVQHRNFPFWFGGLFIFFGAMCSLSERYQSPCVVISNMILNVAGAIFAIVVTAIYSFNTAHIQMWSCYEFPWNMESHHHSDRELMKKKCLEAKKLTVALLRSMNALLIFLSVLALCVTFSSVILGLRDMRSSKRRGNKELYKDL